MNITANAVARNRLRIALSYLTDADVPVVSDYIERLVQSRTPGAWKDPIGTAHKFFGAIPPVDPELKALPDKLSPHDPHNMNDIHGYTS